MNDMKRKRREQQEASRKSIAARRDRDLARAAIAKRAEKKFS